MKCPKCLDHSLEPVDIDGLVVDYCEACEGIFYDEDELQKLILDTYHDEVDIIKKVIKIATDHTLHESRKICPKDHTIMNNVNFPVGSDIIIDICPTCHSIWTDRNETQKILRYFLKITDQQIPEALEENPSALIEMIIKD